MQQQNLTPSDLASSKRRPRGAAVSRLSARRGAHLRFSARLGAVRSASSLSGALRSRMSVAFGHAKCIRRLQIRRRRIHAINDASLRLASALTNDTCRLASPHATSSRPPRPLRDPSPQKYQIFTIQIFHGFRCLRSARPCAGFAFVNDVK
ncbi:hypothetical protein EVAR_4751_1 [Eumeta japonica]|uniref:Uncharacterized protein n=1 Tax=Eumeta variegata TaxID=151549 RepID=A0A4C1T1N2_EUMVA|nr:hypothetical protein EVAR_4751_1 [Eumeta japonica]